MPYELLPDRIRVCPRRKPHIVIKPGWRYRTAEEHMAQIIAGEEAWIQRWKSRYGIPALSKSARNQAVDSEASNGLPNR